MSREQPEAQAVARTAGQPVLSLDSGWPRDALTWIYALISILGLGIVAAASAGIGVYVGALAFDIDPTVAAMLGQIAWVVMWFKFVRRHLGVSHERQRFYSDRVEADLLVRDDHRLVLERFVIPYDSIGAVSLGRRSRIRIQFATPQGDTRSSFDVALPRLIGRDQSDEIVAWIEAAHPDHLFAWSEGGRRHYSRSWELADVFPERRTMAGEAVLVLGDETSSLTCAGRSFEYRIHRFTQIHVVDANSTRPIMAAVWTSDSVSPRVDIVAGSGIEIAECNLSVRTGEVQVELGCDISIRWDARAGTVSIGDEVVGEIAATDSGAVMRLSRAVPEPIVLIVFLIGGFFPHLYALSSQGRS